MTAGQGGSAISLFKLAQPLCCCKSEVPSSPKLDTSHCGKGLTTPPLVQNTEFGAYTFWQPSASCPQLDLFSRTRHTIGDTGGDG